jgi:glycosyltransferase involved in cell wall biosynthesis
MLYDKLIERNDVLVFPQPAPPPRLESQRRHIAVIGNFPPTKCGIATFTQDMVTSIQKTAPRTEVDVYAMISQDQAECRPPLRTLIPENDRTSYRLAGIEIDRSGAEMVWLQHEFGIFGGEAGEWIIDMLRHIAAPLAVTLHTVLENPDEAQKRVMDWLVARASRLVVMSQEGQAILERVYRAEPERISIVPHGVPDRPFGRSLIMKKKFDLSGRHVLMTFGLLSPGKGIETVISALPEIVKEHPNAVYCIVGATHPKLLAREGEAYREQLQEQARLLGVENNIEWINRYLETDELLDLIEAVDVYLTPYAGAGQSTSGTLAYAMALGKAIVSTPYKHAAEILRDGIGLIVPFGDPAALTEAVNGLLAKPDARAAMQMRAYEVGRTAIWPNFARKSLEICDALRTDRRGRLPKSSLPETALLRLCDSCGIIQHSVLSIPDRTHGYCVDDNARALMLANKSGGRFGDLAPVFAAFVQHSWNARSGSFRNFMGYDRKWREDQGSSDSNGRTLWALGCTIAEARDPDLRLWAKKLWQETAPMALRLAPPRAIAFALLGADRVLEVEESNEVALALVERGVEMLNKAYKEHSRPSWRWFEDYLAYDNCRLAEAMLRGAVRVRDDVQAIHALEALDWIVHQQTAAGGHFRPVGANAFGDKAVPGDPFDQQPVDAWAMIDAALAAYRYEPVDRWVAAARSAYGWFFGANDRDLEVADIRTGACRDGLTPRGLNLNQGAESVLALHFAQHGMWQLEAEIARHGTEQENSDAGVHRPVSV